MLFEMQKDKQKLLRAEEDLKSFASVVSHDIKAPLKSVGLLGEWVLADSKDILNKEAVEMLNLMTSRVFEISDLVEGILTYTKVGLDDNGILEVDLNNTIHQVIKLLDPPKHIKIKINTILPTIRVNPGVMQQLFQHLMSNAIKAIDKEEGLIQIDCEEFPNDWKFSMSDNGHGVEEKNTERIFTIFYTLNRSGKKEDKGVGIGLPIVRKIVNILGGTIHVNSRPEKGTSFHFNIPK